MSVSTRRLTGLMGVLAVLAFLPNILFTTDGPRPDRPAVEEAARAVEEAAQLRTSALLLLVESVPTLIFLSLLALAVHSAGKSLLAVLALAFGDAAIAVQAVSAAALAAAPSVAGGGFDPGMVALAGNLHTATLLGAATLFGVALLSLAGSRVVLPAWSSASLAFVGVASLLTGGILGFDDFDFGAGPMALPLVAYFFGWPLWLLVTSVWMLVARWEPMDDTPRATTGAAPVSQ